MSNVTYNPLRDKFETPDYNSSNFLFNACFMVTKRCNFRCIHCSQDAYNPDQDVETYKKYVDKLRTGGLTRLNVSGGESLLYKSLPEFLKHCKDSGLKITLSTNGFLLPEKLPQVKPHIDNVRMSIYGIGNSHDEFTKHPGSFKRLEETLSLLQKESIPTLMIMPTAQRNLDEVNEVIGFCESYGVKRLRFFTLIDMGRAESIFKEESLKPEDIANLEGRVKSYQERYPKMLSKVTDWTKDSTCCFLIEPNSECWFYYANKREKIGSLEKDSVKDLWGNFSSREDLVKYLLLLR